MDKIVDLINLLEISRAQPQYGFAIAGGNARMSNIAEHQYLVAMVGWQLAEIANAAGAKIDTATVIKSCLTHDIGELFGGDIGMYYAKANPTARTLAKKFEEENQRFLSGYFSNASEILALTKEALDSASDEAHITKLADYIEVTHYKLFNGQLKKKDVELVAPKLAEKAQKISDPAARKEMLAFVAAWQRKMLSYDSYLDASTSALEV